MAHGRGTNSKPGVGLQLFWIAQSQLFPRHENVVERAIRRAEPMKFINVIFYPGLPQNSAGENTAADVADGQTVRARCIKKVVGCLATSSARHELTYDLGISRNVFRQKRCDGSRADIPRAARLATLNKLDG